MRTRTGVGRARGMRTLCQRQRTVAALPHAKAPPSPCFPKRARALACRLSYLMAFCPPMSHTFSLKFACESDLTLKPCVGVMVVMSSSLSLVRMVVLPALSRPSTKMRASPCCGLRSLRSSDSRPGCSHAYRRAQRGGARGWGGRSARTHAHAHATQGAVRFPETCQRSPPRGAQPQRQALSRARTMATRSA